ncbi:MAG: biotin transporter BioY [Lachnospiraceae bacterium]|nr:biotin transporter BioY [Lachnospiraceae bacterium]
MWRVIKTNQEIKGQGIRRNETKNMVYCAMFVTLIAAGAFIKIPIPVVPFTLQYLFTMLAGLLLGAKLGCLAVCVYILLGLAGVPVFTQGGGIGYIFQPTFGYIIGFAVGAYVTGKIANGKKNPGYMRLLVANFIGLGIVYLFGMVYYYFISNFYLGTPIGLWPLFLYCFLLVVPGDIVLCILGAVLGRRMIPAIRAERI